MDKVPLTSPIVSEELFEFFVYDVPTCGQLWSLPKLLVYPNTGKEEERKAED